MSAPSGVTEPAPDWVPVEYRVWGIDRRTFVWALPVVVLVITMVWVLPAVERSIGWNDPVEAGDVMITPVDDVTFAPAVGWGIESGLRVGEQPAATARKLEPVITKDGVAFSITTAPWSGSVDELLAQIKETTNTLAGVDELHVTGETAAFTTANGDEGLLVRYIAPNTDGVLGGLVFDGVGVQIVVTGPTDAINDQGIAEDVAAMLQSIQREEPEA